MTDTLTAPEYRATMAEKEMQEAIRRAAIAHGYAVYHTHDSRHSPAGFPDVIAIKGGRVLVLELKAQRGRVSDAQWAWLAAWASTGATVAVVRPEPRDGEISFDDALALIRGGQS